MAVKEGSKSGREDCELSTEKRDKSMKRRKSASSSSSGSSSGSSSSGSSKSSSDSSSGSSSRSRSNSSSSSSAARTKIKRRPADKDDKKKKNVEKSSKHKSRSPSPKRKRGEPRPCRIHIGRLTQNVNKEHIEEVFAHYGTVKFVDFPINRMHNQQSRGYCYVEFSTPEEAETGMKHMDGGQIDGQEITCAPVLLPRMIRRSPIRLPMPRWDERRRGPPSTRYRRPIRRRSPPRSKRQKSRSPRKRRFSRSSSSSSR